MKKITLTTLFFLFFFSSIYFVVIAQVIAYPPTPIFHNGFENPSWSEQYYTKDRFGNPLYYAPYEYGDLHNPDSSVTLLSNWDEDLQGSYELGHFGNYGPYGNFLIKYGVGGSFGTKLQRLGEIIDDPTNPGNNEVFSTWVSETYGNSSAGSGARVETYLNGHHKGIDDKNGTGYEILHYSVKFYMPSQFQELLNVDPDYDLYPGGLTIIQLWNDVAITPLIPGFRLNTMIKKKASNSDFTFHVTAHGLNSNGTKTVIWSEPNLSTPIPLNQWNTLDIYFKEGNLNNGRYRIKLNGATVLDKTNWTHHPYSVNPDGLCFINPFEMYVSELLVDPIADLGYKTEILWDDFKIYDDSKLKQKYIKLKSPSCGSTLTDSNLTVEAPTLINMLPNGNLPFDWEYVFWISNTDPSINNVIQPPPQKSPILNLSNYRNNGDLMNNSTYRFYVAIKNHPFLDQYGTYPNYSCELTTSFTPIGQKNSLNDEITIYPNPTKSHFNVNYTVLDALSSTNLFIVDENNTILLNKEMGVLREGMYTETFDITKLGIHEELLFLIVENGEHRFSKKVLVE